MSPGTHRPIRIGSALFNADHTRLGDELRRTEAAGVDFFHLDLFDGYFVRDQAFPARTIKSLRPLTRLPFEIHLAVNDPVRFLPALKEAGADLVFLPAESTPLLYEMIYTVREHGMKAGLCLALGTPLTILPAVLPMLDSVLLLGRVTGEGARGRDFNQLVVDRVREVRRMIDAAAVQIDLQAAGGLETRHCVEVCGAGATSLPLGGALHRESDLRAYVSYLRQQIACGNSLDAAPSKRPAEQRAALEPVPSKVSTWNVLVASRSFGKNCPDVLDRMKADGCQFLPGFKAAPSEAELLARIAEADVLISGTEPVTANVIAAAPRLKVISKHGVGYDNIDLAAARARNVPVAIAGPAVVDSVADLTFALILAAARKIPQGNASVRAGKWDRFVGPELRGKILGIVGLGQIGKGVCRRAVGFGMQLIAVDAFPDHAFAASWAVRCVSLEQLLSEADFISLHAPSTAETRHLIGSAQLERMKRSTFLINTARGDLVDETALYAALKQGRIAGAAVDVFQQEPPGMSPLLELDNFIATPHCAGQTEEGLRRMGEITAENAMRVLRGEKPLYAVA